MRNFIKTKKEREVCMLKKITILVVLTVISLSFNACTKVEKQAPNHFVKKSSWSVTKLTIGNDNIESLPKWDLETEETGKAIWCHAGGTYSSFFWSFSKNFNTFEFYVDVNDPANKINQAYKQCENLSGKYKVITDKKNLFEFESFETKGYVGPRVYIKIE
jgi:hypothetical protein